MPDRLEQVLTDLYDSAINVDISWMWDGGIDVKLGDAMTGYEAEGTVYSASEIAEWLRENAVRCYPDSEFARKYSKGFV